MLFRSLQFREVSGRVSSTPGETNWALASNGGIASASSTYTGIAGYTPDKAINGDRVGSTAPWGWNDNTASAWPDWLRVTLGTYALISRVVVYTHPDNIGSAIEPTDSDTFTLYGLTAFDVQAWDGSGWVTLASVTGNNKVKRTVTFTPVATADVRIYIPSGPDYSRIVEVEAWGVPASGEAPHGPDYVPPAEPINTTFSLKSPNSGTLPFRIGQTFALGQVDDVDDVLITGASAQVVSKTKYAGTDYIDFAEIAGTYTSTANVAQIVSVTAGTGSNSTPLTSAAITAAAPSCTVQCGSLGTITLSDLFGSPIKTYQAGHKAIQTLYAAHVGSTGLEVCLFVSHWAGSRTKIHWKVTNGPLDNGAGALPTIAVRTFTLTVTIGGSATFNQSVTIGLHGFVDGEGWIGGDPQVTALPDPVQLAASKRVPNTARGGAPSETLLGTYPTTYTPGSRAGHEQVMGSYGAQPQIGILSAWDSIYAACPTADARALNASLIGSRAIGAFAFDYRSYATHRPMKPSVFPNWGLDGDFSSGALATESGVGNTWEFNHAPSVGYLPYLLTADAFYYELCLQNAALNYMVRSYAQGVGLARVPRNAARGQAWAMRSIAQAASIAHDDDDVGAEYKTLLASSFAWLTNRGRANYQAAPIGILYIYPTEAAEEIEGQPGWIRTFFYFYMAQAMGYIRDLRIFENAEDVEYVSDSYHKFITGLAGVSGAPTQFAFTHVTQAYSMAIASGSTSGWYTTFGQVFTGSFGGTTNSTPSNTLIGFDSGLPQNASGGYWGYYLSALAYAVDHGYPGASAGFLRIQGADNISTLENSGFDNQKQWAIFPRVNVEMPDWTIGVVVGQVGKVPGSSFASAPVPSPTPPGSTGPNGRVIAYTGMVLDWVNRVAMKDSDGGHNDYGGNEKLHNALMRSTSLPWEMVRGPTANVNILKGIGGSGGFYPSHYADGRMAASHTTYHQHYRHTDHSLIRIGAYAVYSDPAIGSNRMYRTNLTTLQEDGEGAAPMTNTAFPADMDVAGSNGQANDRSTGRIYYTAGSSAKVRCLKPDNTVIDIGTVPGVNNDWAYEVPMAVDHTRQKLYVIGDAYHSGQGYEFNVADGVNPASNPPTAFTFTGTGAFRLGAANGAAARYVASMDKVVVKTSFGNEIILIDPVTVGGSKTATLISTTGVTAPDANPSAIEIFSKADVMTMPDGTEWLFWLPGLTEIHYCKLT